MHLYAVYSRVAYHYSLSARIYLCLVNFQKLIYLSVRKLGISTVHKHFDAALFTCAVANVAVSEKVLCTDDKSAVKQAFCECCAKLGNGIQVTAVALVGASPAWIDRLCNTR